MMAKSKGEDTILGVTVLDGEADGLVEVVLLLVTDRRDE
jgi:hypothetical protein